MAMESAPSKSFLTNLAALLSVFAGVGFAQPLLFHMGLFALSGALTNWLAIHMLFEKVPGLYGSGVIPSRFEDFKAGLYQLMMEQFFTQRHVERLFDSSQSESEAVNLAFDDFIDELDLEPSFDSFVEVIKGSSFAGLLGMVGGSAVLAPLRAPFIKKMRETLKDIAHSEDFQYTIQANIMVRGHLLDKVSMIVRKRLDELTPQLVKDIIQKMIRHHLGWLVIWGGVFGALFGALFSWMPTANVG